MQFSCFLFFSIQSKCKTLRAIALRECWKIQSWKTFYWNLLHTVMLFRFGEQLIHFKWICIRHGRDCTVHQNRSVIKKNKVQINVMFCAIWYHLYNFKKVKKHPWRSVTFSKITGFLPATLLKVTLFHGASFERCNWRL